MSDITEEKFTSDTLGHFRNKCFSYYTTKTSTYSVKDVFIRSVLSRHVEGKTKLLVKFDKHQCVVYIHYPSVARIVYTTMNTKCLVEFIRYLYNTGKVYNELDDIIIQHNK